MKIYSLNQTVLSYKQELNFEYEGEEFYIAYYWESEQGYRTIWLRDSERLSIAPDNFPDWLDEDFLAELDNEAYLYKIEQESN